MEPTYQNPVYPHSCPDPFVLKHRGEYWAYCTGVAPDGRPFGVLRSPDLLRWQFVGGALEPLPEPHPHYWAPEVTYHNGRFYLYYSVGDEVNMQMRVGVASHPAGPFADSGRRLTREQFAIDGHVFVDDDGAWHLFYATDFLEHPQIGTGTVRDRMLDPLTLAGRPQPVTLPRYDWHVYDPQRAEKGGVRWHTIEGPFVLVHKRRFYQMFSGGNWQNPTYGVSYAVAARPDQPGEWEQVADGERVRPVLCTIPGQVIGPGHNSVVRGPDNRQLYAMYHRWHDGARVLSIDRLEWAGERMLIDGPSVALALAPNPATLVDQFAADDASGLGPGWQCQGGRWQAREGTAQQLEPRAGAQASRALPSPSGLLEVTVRALGQGEGGYGVAWGQLLQALVEPSAGQLRIRRHDGRSWHDERVPLPAEFNPEADQLLRLEVNARSVNLTLGHVFARWHGELLAAPAADTCALVATMPATFAGFALTAGWEDRFEQTADMAVLGWEAPAGAGWRVSDAQLWRAAGEPALAAKGPALPHYELLVNARTLDASTPIGYGVYPAYAAGQPGPLLRLEQEADGWAMVCHAPEPAARFALPDFDPSEWQQLRFRKRGDRLTLWRAGKLLGELPAPAGPAQVALLTGPAGAAFDLVRVSQLGGAAADAAPAAS